MESVIRRSVGWGLAGAWLLLLFYWLVLSLANSLDHAVEQWRQWWYWIVLLVVGFGSQAGLYSYIRYGLRERKAGGVSGEVAAAGGVSAGSMVACCAHHVADALPILGLSAVAVFLTEYQLFFIVVGVVSNAIGVIYLLEVVKKHSLYKRDSGLGRLEQFDISQWRRWALAGSVLVLVVVFVETQGTAGQQKVGLLDAVGTAWPTRTDVAGGLTVEATPVKVEPGKPVQFDVALDTHQGGLDFDLAEQAVLIDGAGGEYSPIEWQGAKGSHHLSGRLVFPPLDSEAAGMALVIRNVYGVAERVFEWGEVAAEGGGDR